MKRFIFILLVPFLVATVQIQAQNTNTKQDSKDTLKTVSTFRGPNFTDANNDGICDHRENRDGLNRGPGFTDENKDGICDHRENRTGKDKNINKKGNRNSCPGRGPGGGNGFRHRHGWRWQE